MKITSKCRDWIKQEHPNLRIKRTAIVGTLQFAASYEKRRDLFYIWDIDIDPHTANFIKDCFTIKINITEGGLDENTRLPKVYEIGGRAKSLIGEKNIPYRELHINLDKDGSCCLTALRMHPEQITLREFIEELVTPFFYRLSYVEKYGLKKAKASLWPERPHGNDGQLEALQEMGIFDI